VRAGRHGRRTGPAGLLIRGVGELAIHSVAARRGAELSLRQAVMRDFGFALPEGPRRIAEGGIAALGAGPAQWLVTAEGEAAAGLGERLQKALGAFAALVDLSHAYLTLRLEGPQVRAVLAKGVPVDVHPRVFASGDVAATQVAQVAVRIAQISEAPSYDILVPATFAESFWDWLTASAAEFGYDVQI
jgi:sarcosine oxidase subunit gamma